MWQHILLAVYLGLLWFGKLALRNTEVGTGLRYGEL